MKLYEELTRRGLIAQTTNAEAIQKALDEGKVTFYIGFDATADSLHVGHFLQLMIMARMQKAGNVPIVLLGTGTTMVGDPTGKTDMRKMLTEEQIDHNAERFRQQMSKFIDFSEGKAILAKNGDWLKKLNYIEFLRDIGVHFTVNRMLAAECYKARYERGLTFIEFNYMIMQSYDFLKLHEMYGCTMEMGGDDQWSNILGGVDLTRRVTGDEVYGITFTLLTTKEGKKMGKTENGAVWLDREKTSPYEFFQYWRNVADDDVINCLKLLTFVPIEEIEAMESWEGSQLNKAKEILAYELTKTVHSAEDADAALAASRALFSGAGDSETMPSTQLSEEDFANGKIGILDLMVRCGLCASKGEARRLVNQGGVTAADEKIADANQTFPKEAFADGLVLKKGKKVFHKATL